MKVCEKRGPIGFSTTHATAAGREVALRLWNGRRNGRLFLASVPDKVRSNTDFCSRWMAQGVQNPSLVTNCARDLRIMAWPNIFWPKGSKKPAPASNASTTAALKQSLAAASIDPKAATTEAETKAAPAPATPTTTTPSGPAITPAADALPAPGPTKSGPVPGRTIPALHGVVLRPPARLAPTVTGPPSKPPVKNIEQLMAEADPVRTLSQTGSIRLLKRLTPDSSGPKPPITLRPPSTAVSGGNVAASPWPQFTGKAPSPAPEKKPELSTTPLPHVIEGKKPEPISPAAAPPVVTEAKQPDPTPVTATPPAEAIETKQPDVTLMPPPFPNPPLTPESPFMQKSILADASTAPTVSDAPASGVSDSPPASVEPIVTGPPPEGSGPESPMSAVVRRRAKLADVARIVLPPKREETVRLPHMQSAKSTTTTVIPPAFPVAAMTVRATAASSAPDVSELSTPAPVNIPPLEENPFLTKTVPAEAKTDGPSPIDLSPAQTERPKPVDTPLESATPPPAPTPVVEQKTEPKTTDFFADPPKIDPEAHKPDVMDNSAPKIDSEAHRPPPTPAPSPSESATQISVAPESPAKEKREFHLTNGEHVAGVVLSESPEAIYVEHATLGVITVPRKEIAQRLVEIILINGDRIVGDIMAETADTLYVRHASLGMLTVPRAQRSTRVVEAILKDGDRILGEVLTETDTFTVIRSATLGTITIPHTKLAMMNRKIEQIEMRALPPAKSELKDKSS
jgi:RNase P/RNase MRP subunit p29